MWKIILVLSILSVVIYGQQGLTDIDIKSDGFTSQYSFTIDYENVGSGGINNLELKEILQVGWSLNTNLSTPGWSCGESLCTFSLPSVAPLSSGSVLFVVNVDQSSQVNGNGTKKCWENIVSSTFTDEDYDPTPNNNQASVKIGSSCSTCCDPAPCPINTCQLTCPPQNITAPCPEVGCNCKVPEYYCPPCKKEENNCASTCGMPEVDACSSVNCDDGNLCTADSCSGGNCTHTPISCNDGNACTTDTCNPSTGCIRTSISCDDGNLCTTDSCSGGNCTHSPISCDDGNACTIDTCNPTTGCVHTERNCSSNDFCQINGRCDRATGTCISDPRTCTGSNLCAQSAFCNSTARACQDVPKVCTNNACYTNGACNITTGACDYTRTTCNDNNSCTNNRCDNTTGCYFPPVVCSDNNTCSVDYCSPTTGTCIFTFYCSNTDECFNRVCTNECPSSGECTGDPSTTAALSASVINQRMALNCKVTPTGLPNCGKK